MKWSPEVMAPPLFKALKRSAFGAAALGATGPFAAAAGAAGVAAGAAGAGAEDTAAASN